MTTKEMLEKIVQAAIEGGFDPDKMTRDDLYKYSSFEYYAEHIQFYYRRQRGKGAVFIAKDMSPSDLILNRSFMEAIWPNKGSLKVPIFVDHTIQAAKLSLTTGIEAAIKYLYDNLPVKGEE